MNCPFAEALAEAARLVEKKQYDNALQLLEQVDTQRVTREEAALMRKLALLFPKDIAARSTPLCFGMALLEIGYGNAEATATWQNRLTAQRELYPEDTPQRRLLENRIFCCNLALPQGQNANILFSLAVLAHEYADSKLPLAKLSATAKLPSILRGAKDFSTLGKHYKASASMLRPLLPTVLAHNAFGVCETGIAEILYQRNDINAAALQAAAATNAEDPEIAFAALAVMAQVAAIDQTGAPASEYLEHIGGVLEKKNACWLLPNYKALQTRHNILTGDKASVKKWLGESSLNDMDTVTLDTLYEAATRGMAHLALGQYRDAATLFETLSLAAKGLGRPMDEAECLVLGAVVCQQLGSADLAMLKIEKALIICQEYSYVRLIADCGKAAFQLLNKYAKSASRSDAIEEKYLRRVIDAAGHFSTLYPALYDGVGNAKAAAPAQAGKKQAGPGGAPAGVSLTNSELHVLQLMDSGRSNKDIAAELVVSASTVKFHISNIMGKLGAANRVEAIKRARDMGILA